MSCCTARPSRARGVGIRPHTTTARKSFLLTEMTRTHLHAPRPLLSFPRQTLGTAVRSFVLQKGVLKEVAVKNKPAPYGLHKRTCKLFNGKMEVVRLLSNGSYGCSHPCSTCRNLLIYFNIHICYSDTDGSMVKSKAKDLKVYHRRLYLKSKLGAH